MPLYVNTLNGTRPLKQYMFLQQQAKKKKNYNYLWYAVTASLDALLPQYVIMMAAMIIIVTMFYQVASF